MPPVSALRSLCFARRSSKAILPKFNGHQILFNKIKALALKKTAFLFGIKNCPNRFLGRGRDGGQSGPSPRTLRRTSRPSSPWPVPRHQRIRLLSPAHSPRASGDPSGRPRRASPKLPRTPPVQAPRRPGRRVGPVTGRWRSERPACSAERACTCGSPGRAPSSLP
jgi:hypothetical protein